MPVASYRPQYAENNLLQLQMETEETARTRGIAKATLTTIDIYKFYNKGSDALVATSLNCKQENYGTVLNTINDICGQAKTCKNKDNCEDDRKGVTEEFTICIQPRHCNKQIRTTKINTTTNTRAANLNIKCQGFPDNIGQFNSSNDDYKQTKNRTCSNSNSNNNNNNKFPNSIISILHCKQFKATQQKQQLQQQLYYKHLYLTPHPICPSQCCQPQHPASFTPPHKSILSHTYKMTTFSQDRSIFHC